MIIWRKCDHAKVFGQRFSSYFHHENNDSFTVKTAMNHKRPVVKFLEMVLQIHSINVVTIKENE